MREPRPGFPTGWAANLFPGVGDPDTPDEDDIESFTNKIGGRLEECLVGSFRPPFQQ